MNERKLSIWLIVCCQILFLVTLLFFREVIHPGFSFFRVTTAEEWARMIQEPENASADRIYLWISAIQFAFLFALGRRIVVYYRKHRICAWNIAIPVIVLGLYLPCFFYFKYEAERYYLWMHLIPVEVCSFLLLLLLVFSKERKDSLL